MRKLHKFDKRARAKYLDKQSKLKRGQYGKPVLDLRTDRENLSSEGEGMYAKRYHRFTYDDLENIVETMSDDEKTTLALGFYNYDEAVGEEVEALGEGGVKGDDFDEFELGEGGVKGDDFEEFDDFTDYVDDDFAYQSFDEDEDDDFDNVITDGDDWIGAGDEDFLNAHHSKKKTRGGGKDAFTLKGSHHINFNDDGEVELEGGDDEFDNLLSKKGRKRRKLRRKKRKALKKSGVSRKEARKQARKEARKEIPRDTLKETAKKSWKKIKKGVKAVGKVIKKGAFFIPRQSARSLVQINYRGLAEKLKKGQEQSKIKKKLKKKWVDKLGGKMSSLQKAIDKGAKKKPFTVWCKM
jgi:hypothetical protein